MKKAMKNKEVKELISLVSEKYSYELPKDERYEKNDNIILVNNEPLFFYFEEKIVPSLRLLLDDMILKKITIDMGAVPYAAKGADMMRPGITNIDDSIEKDDFVVVIDETHSKPIAVGVALFNSQDIKTMYAGKVVKNIHYIGDNIWNSA